VKLIPKVRSLSQLRQLASTDDRYRRLALVAAANLGGTPTEDLNRAMSWLYTNANETTESGVVAEVNFVRDCI
jgi:hypothetical protein